MTNLMDENWSVTKQRPCARCANGADHLFAHCEGDGHGIGLFVVKPDALFLVKLKRAGGPGIGAINDDGRVLIRRPYRDKRLEKKWKTEQFRDYLALHRSVSREHDFIERTVYSVAGADWRRLAFLALAPFKQNIAVSGDRNAGLYTMFPGLQFNRNLVGTVLENERNIEVHNGEGHVRIEHNADLPQRTGQLLVDIPLNPQNQSVP